MTETAPAKLALEDGTVVTGIAVGARGETGGELCFNTSMSGYQEILTDPSYVGQLMMMTYPHIGNYGAMEAATESDRPEGGRPRRARVSRRRLPMAMSEESLAAYMERHGLVGISGIDTRQARAAHPREGRDERRRLVGRPRRREPGRQGEGTPEHGRAASSRAA